MDFESQRPMLSESYAGARPHAKQTSTVHGNMSESATVYGSTANTRSSFRMRKTRYVLNSSLILGCLAVGFLTVAENHLAVRLGQTNQLIVIGFVLALMAGVTFKEAQTLLLILEARFGESTLQNFDAIIRDDKFGFQISFLNRLALLFNFALPLVLSVLYKQSIGGSTAATVSNTQHLLFGPSGPPGLFMGNGLPLFANASAALFAGHEEVPGSDPIYDTSLGYNMHIINETTSTMLDTPIGANISYLQSQCVNGRTLTLSARVNATFAMVNSTPSSPERQSTDYWPNAYQRWGYAGKVDAPLGESAWFSVAVPFIDNSIYYLAYYNTSKGESFNNTAIAFNAYRGTSRGTWLISNGHVRLLHAEDFQTNFSPLTQHPELHSARDCGWDNATDFEQKIVYCTPSEIPSNFIYSMIGSIVGHRLAENLPVPIAPLPYWTSTVAAAAWSSASTKLHFSLMDSDTYSKRYQYLGYTPPYELIASSPTLTKSWSLYATIATQPIVLLTIFILRYLLRSTPIGDNFGLISFLAGVQKDSLYLLHGASYTGELKTPIRVDMMVHNHDYQSRQGSRFEPSIEYTLSNGGDIIARKQMM